MAASPGTSPAAPSSLFLDLHFHFQYNEALHHELENRIRRLALRLAELILTLLLWPTDKRKALSSATTVTENSAKKKSRHIPIDTWKVRL